MHKNTTQSIHLCSSRWSRINHGLGVVNKISEAHFKPSLSTGYFLFSKKPNLSLAAWSDIAHTYTVLHIETLYVIKTMSRWRH